MYISIDLSIKSAGVAIQYKKEGKEYTILYSPTEYKVNDEKSCYGEINKNQLCICFIHNNIIEKFKENHLDLKENYFERIKHNVKIFMNALKYIISMVENYAEDKEMKFSIESYSYNAQGMNYDIGEFGGIIKYYIEETYKTKVLSIPPTSIKKFAYKGNATKEEMVNAAMNRNEDLKKAFNEMKEYYVKRNSEKNPLYESPFNDLVDAYFQLEYFKSLNH